MKKLKMMVTAALMLLLSPVFGQKSIEAMPLGITFSKTTTIIFPHPIISVDRGSADVLAQKAAGVENILLVKAAKKGFVETNISVVTADGNLSSFLLSYTEQPSILNLSMGGNIPHATHVFLSKENVNEAVVQRFGEQAKKQKDKRLLHEHKGGISFDLTGLYVHEEMMYVKVKITNISSIDFTVDQFRFYIRDQRRAKRTAAQEVEIEPVYVVSENDKIPANHYLTMVYAFPKFTIPEDKYLAVQVMEQNGGRNMELHIKNRRIMKAMILKSPADKAEVAF